jgi:2-hydroxychromene-2-carboxylate isomerase
MRWPDPWPTDYLVAMRAATFAFAMGRGREFTMQAFRDAFRRGVDLSNPAHVLAAAQRAGLDRMETERAVADPTIKRILRQATDGAYATGVFGVPTVAVDSDLFWGDDRLEDAAARLSGLTAPA